MQAGHAVAVLRTMECTVSPADNAAMRAAFRVWPQIRNHLLRRIPCHEVQTPDALCDRGPRRS
jgi:hypothetical protein